MTFSESNKEKHLRRIKSTVTQSQVEESNDGHPLGKMLSGKMLAPSPAFQKALLGFYLTQNITICDMLYIICSIWYAAYLQAYIRQSPTLSSGIQTPENTRAGLPWCWWQNIYVGIYVANVQRWECWWQKRPKLSFTSQNLKLSRTFQTFY